MRKFIAIEDYKEDGMFYIGAFESYQLALGVLMNDVFDLRDCYTRDDDFFDIGDLVPMAGDGGTCIDVRFRRGKSGKTYTQSYLILFDDGDGKKPEKEGKRPEKACDLMTAEEAFEQAKINKEQFFISTINGCIERGETSVFINTSIGTGLKERLKSMGYSVDVRDNAGVKINWEERPM